MRKTLLAGACLIALAAMPAVAGDYADWTLSPYETEISGVTLLVGGAAQGTLSEASQPVASGLNKTAVSGAATLTAAFEHDYDSGMMLALKTAFQLYHDRLAGDNYGNDLVQKVYGQLQTGLGSLEVGMNDGAAFALAVTGPVVDGEVALDNPNATFFRDSSTGRAAIENFALNGAVEPSYNYAKISYYTPKLFGVQIGASYTPATAKDVIPFVSSGDKAANRQDSIWEIALAYDDSFGPFETRFSFAAAFAHADEGSKTAGHAGLTDWAAGGEIAYPLGEETKLSVGGAYHHANSYAFDIGEVLTQGGTDSSHLGAKLENGAWAFGLEYGDGTADGGSLQPTVGVRGYGAALGYVIDRNLAATLGWQELRYRRDAGAFYNGGTRLHLDALFLHLHFQVQ